MRGPIAFTPVFPDPRSAAIFLIDLDYAAQKLGVCVKHISINHIGCVRFQPAWSGQFNYGDCAALDCFSDVLSLGREDCPSCGHVDSFPNAPLPLAAVPEGSDLESALIARPDSCGSIPSGAILALANDWKDEVRAWPQYDYAVETIAGSMGQQLDLFDLREDKVLPTVSALREGQLCDELMRRGHDD